MQCILLCWSSTSCSFIRGVHWVAFADLFLPLLCSLIKSHFEQQVGHVEITNYHVTEIDILQLQADW